MFRRTRLSDEQLERLRQAYLEAEDRAPASTPESYEGLVAFERDHLSYQILDSVERYMQAHGWDNKELAARLGVTEGRVSQILSGEQNLTLKTLASLAAALQGHFHITLADAPVSTATSDRGEAPAHAERQARADARSAHFAA
jgi:transcriptional regulator with XRE-family HTH domain